MLKRSSRVPATDARDGLWPPLPPTAGVVMRPVDLRTLSPPQANAERIKQSFQKELELLKEFEKEDFDFDALFSINPAKFEIVLPGPCDDDEHNKEGGGSAIM